MQVINPRATREQKDLISGESLLSWFFHSDKKRSISAVFGTDLQALPITRLRIPQKKLALFWQLLRFGRCVF